MIPHADQPTSQPLAHIARKAMALPSGRLKPGISVAEYLGFMLAADRLDRRGIRSKVATHADAAKLMADIESAAIVLTEAAA